MKQLFFVLFSISLLFVSCENEWLPTSETIPETTLNVIRIAEPTGIRNCGSEALMDRLMQDPDYANAFRAKLQQLEHASESRVDCATPVLIPVAIHFQGLSNPDRPCLETMAQEQIAALNADYTASNGEIDNWSANVSDWFPGINIRSACMEFVIASQNHPAGSGLTDGQLAVTINQVDGDFDSDWSGYLNIFVIKNTGYLGYAPLGGDGNGDGVVIDAEAFGTGRQCSGIGASAPFDKGRTLTHELGHYLFLDHIWGNGCNVDDGVSDTPDQANENYGCPDLGISSCGSPDLHMNYMDYTDDACMYMFTLGQVNRMENYLNTSLEGILSNAASVLGEGNNGGGGGTTPDPSCTDGIQNGDETGVDCGGSCTPCEVPQVCSSPEAFVVTNIDATSYHISWLAPAEAQRFRFRYRKTGDSWTGVTILENAYTLEDLIPGQTYQFQVRTYCTSGGWQTWSQIGTIEVANTPTPPGGGGDCADYKVTMKLVLDDFGSETSWVLKNAANQRIASGGTYGDFQSGKMISEDFCLPDGCYKFVLRDSYGDGICCYYGNGSLSLEDGNGVLIAASDGRFGRAERINFCVGNAGRMQETQIEKDAQAPVNPAKLERLQAKP